MARVLIIYESMYGNTKQVAEEIIKEMQEIKATETTLKGLKEVDLNHVADFDLILIGSPNHMGTATRGIRKFIDSLGKLNLEKKKTAVFDTYMGREFEKAVKKMEQQIGKKAPGLQLITPGLSIRVDSTKGPISQGELPKCQEFGLKVLHQTTG